MSPPDDLELLRDMLDYARRVEQIIAGASRVDFDRDEYLQTTVVHYVQIIGEAATKISTALKAEHSEIPWVDITGMRHKIVHGYRELNLNKVWSTATVDIPNLVATLANLLP